MIGCVPMRSLAHVGTFVEHEGGVDQGNVRKGLREIAYLALGDRIVLFCEQSQIIAQRQKPLKKFAGIALAAEAWKEIKEAWHG